MILSKLDFVCVSMRFIWYY